MLYLQEGEWTDVSAIARKAHKPEEGIAEALQGLVAEEVIETERDGDGRRRFRLAPDDPSTIVVGRLVRESLKHLDLRQLIAARMAQTAYHL